MFSIRRALILFALAGIASSAAAQSGPVLTPSAFIQAPGHLSLDVLGQTIGKEPNFLTFAQTGKLDLRTRADGPTFRLIYVPSERAEFTVEWVSQTYAIKDPAYKKTVSDFGDATLRAKLGLAKGEVSSKPAVAMQFEVTLPNTSFGNGLGPNTFRFASVLVVSYKTEKFKVDGSAGLAISEEPLRAHEQRDFTSLSAAVAYNLTEHFELFGDVGGYIGDGAPGAIAKREARAGVQYKKSLFGRDSSLFLAGRRGLVDFQGKWGVVAGFTTRLKAGV